MNSALPSPVAETKSVTDLVRLVVSGRIRVPVYQRDLQWEADDVLALFDSIYRGYPIGSLLFHRHAAPAATLELGPLLIHASEDSAALDVVDGQQRLVALAAGLTRPLPLPRKAEDPYIVYFDPREEKFVSPPRNGDVPEVWVPMPPMSDGSQLTEWVFNWAYGRDETLRRRVFDAGARIREYKIPAYTVEVAEQDSELLREIFHRVNSSGKPLKWPVIYNALYGRRRGEEKPSTLEELVEALLPLGMGRLEPQDLLRCLIAYEGRDVTQSLDVHLRQARNILDGTAARALPTIRRVLSFLRAHAGIVHERLLPRTAPLTVLTRFFRLHPDPSPRSIELLSRWLWRSFLGTKSFDERTFQRRGVSEIDDNEEESVQRLLDFLPKHDPGPLPLTKSFDSRAAESRIALLGMVSLAPRDLQTGQPLDVATLIEHSDREAFRRIISRTGLDMLSSPANRIILPGEGVARAEIIQHIESGEYGSLVLNSHAISPLACAALLAGDLDLFLQERERDLSDATQTFTRRLASWSRSDRPSIDYLLESST